MRLIRLIFWNVVYAFRRFPTDVDAVAKMGRRCLGKNEFRPSEKLASEILERIPSPWDIRLQCTICGQRKRRCRADGNPPYGHSPQSTTTVVCDQCSAESTEEIKTLHFVDYATENELTDAKYTRT